MDKEAVDLQAFTREWYPKTRKIILLLVNQGICAENAQQNLWFKICTGWPFEHVQDLNTYICAMARHCVIDEQARAKRHDHAVLTEAMAASLGPSPYAYTLARERVTAVRKALTRMTPAMQITAALHWWQGLTIKEIAQKLNIPQATVRSRIRTIRVALTPTTDQ